MQVKIEKEDFRALPFDEKSFPVGSFFTWDHGGIAGLAFLVLHWNPLFAKVLYLDRMQVEIYDIDSKLIYYRLEPISINLKRI